MKEAQTKGERLISKARQEGEEEEEQRGKRGKKEEAKRIEETYSIKVTKSGSTNSV